jgi:hypothetical protein
MGMARYLISFPDGAMDHIPEEEGPDVAKAAHAVVQDALNAGVYLFAGGLELQRPSVVATDGAVTDGPYPPATELSGGFTVVDVPTREAALGVGREDRGRLPLCARGTGVRARPRTRRNAPPGG